MIVPINVISREFVSKGYFTIIIKYLGFVIVKKDFGAMIVPFQKEIKDNNVHMSVIIMVIVFLENAVRKI